MDRKALADFEYQIEKISFEVDGDEVIKVSDVIEILSNMVEDGEQIVSKAKVREALDHVMRENYSRLLNELWAEMDRKLDN